MLNYPAQLITIYSPRLALDVPFFPLLIFFPPLSTKIRDNNLEAFAALTASFHQLINPSRVSHSLDFILAHPWVVKLASFNVNVIHLADGIHMLEAQFLSL